MPKSCFDMEQVDALSFTSVFICNYGNPTDVKENMQKYNSQGVFFSFFFLLSWWILVITVHLDCDL